MRLLEFGSPYCGTVGLDYLIGHFETLIHEEEDACEDLGYKHPRTLRLRKALDAYQLLNEVAGLT